MSNLHHKTISRRQFLRDAALLGVTVAVVPTALSAAKKQMGSNIQPSNASCPAAAKPGTRSLFDGKTLNGWTPMPRLYIPRDEQFAEMNPDDVPAAVIEWYKQHGDQQRAAHTGRWEVVDGAIEGGHDPDDSIYGAYLISNEKFGDFELELDANPDWPADTGIMIRANGMASLGFQVLYDYRPHGTIGGVYGNSLGNFLASGFIMTGDRLPGFRVANLRSDDEAGPAVRVPADYTASFDDFIKVWRLNDWNHIKIRCVGRLPLITTWINGTKICELNTANIQGVPGYDAEKVAKRLGREGHIAFEVHDVPPNGPLKRDRWEVGAKCRWKNITITTLE